MRGFIRHLKQPKTNSDTENKVSVHFIIPFFTGNLSSTELP